jgi:hypothetical protein
MATRLCNQNRLNNPVTTPKSITLFRIIVLALAIGFWINQFFISDMDRFGIQFRFLTIWTMTFNIIVAAQMLRLSMGKSVVRMDAFVGLVIVMNMAVVVQYWRLMMIDPTLVQSNGPLPWWREYYIHAVGPLLMWIDAFLILGAFRRIQGTCFYALLIGILYPLWIELLVRPMNTLPAGSVTNGLPYPFLNDLTLGGRMVFYTISSVANFVFIAVGVGLARLIKIR